MPVIDINPPQVPTRTNQPIHIYFNCSKWRIKWYCFISKIPAHFLILRPIPLWFEEDSTDTQEYEYPFHQNDLVVNIVYVWGRFMFMLVHKSAIFRGLNTLVIHLIPKATKKEEEWLRIAWALYLRALTMHSRFDVILTLHSYWVI